MNSPVNLLLTDMYRYPPHSPCPLSEDQKTDALSNLKKFIDSTNAPPGVTVKLAGSAALKKEMKTEMGKSR